MTSPSTVQLALASTAMSGGTLQDAAAVEQTLFLADVLGQVYRHGEGDACEGAVAWLRGRPEDIQTFRRAKIEELAAIPVALLRGGPVIYIAEVIAVTHGWVYNAVRKLRHLEGVEYWCGWRDRTRWAEGPVRRH